MPRCQLIKLSSGCLRNALGGHYHEANDISSASAAIHGRAISHNRLENGSTMRSQLINNSTNCYEKS